MANITWNPSDKGSLVTLSNNNLTSTINTLGSARATVGRSSGKWYWEITVNTVGYNVFVGVGTQSAGLETALGLGDAYGWSYSSYYGYIYNNGVNTTGNASYVANDIIGVALDCDNNSLTFYKNGVVQPSKYTTLPSAGTNIYPMIGSSSGGTASITTVNFGANLFKNTIPTGYSPYETNNVYLRVKSTVALMATGDFIPCRYSATASGQLGLFSELGNTATTATQIPVTSSATPDGSFYWVHSGYDPLGRMKLIADRNIQNSISWDVLNSGGVASGRGVDVGGMFVNSFTKLANPDVLPASNAQSVAFSPDGNYKVVAHTNSPYITIYKRNGDTFTKLADPSTLPTAIAYGVAFSADGNYMSVAIGSAPYVIIYKRSGDVFTKLANPSTLPATSTANGVAFSNDGNYMAVAGYSSPYITIYKITSGDVFTKLADPSTLPTSTGFGVSFSSDGNYMSVAHETTPFVTIYKRSGDTFTKLANPSTLPTGIGRNVTFSNDGTYMSVAHYTSPYVTTYKITVGDVFTKLANPSTLPTANGIDVAFSNDGNYMSVSYISTPYIIIYKRSGDVFTKLTNPSTLPTSTGFGVAFSPDGVYMSVAHTGSPYVTTYKLDPLETRTTKTIRLLTGGTSATDVDNEWDRIIVGGTLNNNITAGDNNVWNWSGVASWTSTVGTTNTYRVARGNTTVLQTQLTVASTYVGTGIGFRPMMLVEIPPNLNPLINSLLKTLINNNRTVQLSATSISDPDSLDKLKYQIAITKPDASVVIKRAYDSTFQSNPMTFNTINFLESEFGVGINTISIDVMDDMGGTVQATVQVVKSPIIIKSLLQDGFKWKYIVGSTLVEAITDYTIDTAVNKEGAFVAHGMGTSIALTPVLNSQIENPSDFKVVVDKTVTLSLP